MNTRDESLARVISRAIEVQLAAREVFGDEVQDCKLSEECTETVLAHVQSSTRNVTTNAIATEAAQAIFVALGFLARYGKLHLIERQIDAFLPVLTVARDIAATTGLESFELARATKGRVGR